MAYLDLVSQEAFGRYNIMFAHIGGLELAVYWSAITKALSAVRKKKTYDEQGFFKLDRKYVTDVTTIDECKQIELDAALVKLKIMTVDEHDVNRLCINMENFVALICNTDTKTLKDIKITVNKTTRAGKAEGKRAGIITRLTNRITETDPELFDLYEKLLDACYSKGLQSNAQIDLFQDTLNDYTTNKEIKMEILKIAIAKAYRDVTWAISIYEKDHHVNSVTRLGTQKISTAIDESIEF